MRNPPKLCLASASPRRQELLTQLKIDFVVESPEVDERRYSGEPSRRYVLRLATEKARAIWNNRENRGAEALPVLGADTAVALGQHIFGKPANRHEALAALNRLSGRTHHVFSALALVRDARVLTAVNCTKVSFAALEPAMLAAYLETGEADDKAGGYGIQGLAAEFISHIDGSYSGVMGLPLYELNMLIRQSGWFEL